MSRFERCNPEPACFVKCVRCAGTLAIGEAWADLDGKAFVDYYCDTCKESKEADDNYDGPRDVDSGRGGHAEYLERMRWERKP